MEFLKFVQRFTVLGIIQNNKSWEELIAYFPWYDTDSIEKYSSKNSSILAYAFVAAVTFLPSCCLATIGGYRHADWWVGFMKYVIEMGSCPMIYIPSVIKILVNKGRQTRRWRDDHLSLLLFFQNKESRLKINIIFLYTEETQCLSVNWRI
jgi:hypothetical protein